MGPFTAERLEFNVSRLKVALPVSVAVHLLHLAMFGATLPADAPAAEQLWRQQVFGTHAVMAVLCVVWFLLLRTRARALVPVAAFTSWLSAGALLAGFDQAVTTDTSPWLVVVLLGALLFRLSLWPLVSAVAVAFAVYLAAQWASPAEPAVRLSNSVKGLSVAVMGGFLGAVLSQTWLRERRQAQLIAQQQRELEADARASEAANEAKSRFLATISHELRTPLSGVLGLTDLLHLTSLDARQRELLETIRGSGASMVALINDLLDLSKAEAGRLEVERRPFDLHGEVHAAVQLFAGRAAEKRLTLEHQQQGAPPVLLGDALRLRQVVSNLVSNALKFTAAGQVVVRSRAVAQGAQWAVQLEVQDSGPGIDAETQARLFVPYSQASASVARTQGGTGLGLAISRQLVTAMGGELTLTSAPGQGSTFRATLTLDAAPEGTTLASAEVFVPTPLAGRVLVVEDDAVNRLVNRELLTQLRLEVFVLNSATEAVPWLEQHAVDLVLTDLNMPGLSGLQLVQWLRARPGAPRAVVLTADASAEDKRACEAAGADGVLEKPVRLAALHGALRGLLPAAPH